MELTDKTITELTDKLLAGDLTSVQLTEEYLKKINKDETNAFLGTYGNAVAQAKEADKRRKEGDPGPLCGIPFAVKDNILVAGETASAGSKILEDYTASYSATAIERLKDAGAVLLGRTNMDEFAMGSSTEHSAFGPTKNPKDPSRVPGGSSGGSAAAVAAGLTPAALGSDTGGSVRQPASFCGVVGLKPTYGAVSRFGLIALGSSLDQIGSLTNSVADAEIIFEAIAGSDEKDSTTISADTYPQPSGQPETIGVPEDLITAEGVDDVVRENFKKATDTLSDCGYKIKTVDLDALKHALAIYYIIMPAEASSNLARYDGVKFGLRTDDSDLLNQYIHTRRDGFGAEVKRRILLGTYVLSAGYYDAYYRTAVEARRVIRDQLADVFSEVDAIVTPTTPVPAFPLGDKTDDPLAMYLQDIFTVSANIAGTPALSVPSGTTKIGGSDLPLGLQIQAPHNHEQTLFAIGKKFESAQ